MKTTNFIFCQAKKSLKLSVPLLFSEWLYAINFFVTTWIAAQLGKETLSALAITNSIYTLIMMMISGISAATAVLAAQDLGAKNVDRIKHIFAQSVLLLAVLAFFASVILWNVPHILGLLKITDMEVTELTKTALHSFLISLWPLTFLIMVEKLLIGIHRTRLVLFFTTLTIPVSICANYSLVLGRFGLPKLGIAGFGFGYAIAYIILGVMFIIMTCTMPSLRSYKLFSAFKKLAVNFKYCGEIWRIGWPLGMMFSIEVGAITIFTFFMSSFGTDALAAFQITRQYLVFAIVTLFALTESAAVQVSHAVGEGDRQLVQRCFYANISITVVFMLILACVYIVPKQFLISLDINVLDPKNHNIIAYTKHFLTAIAVLVLFDGIRNITAGALRGLKDTKSSLYASIIGYWLIGLPLAYLLGKVYDLGAEWLWVGFILGIVISSIYLLWRYQKLYSSIDLKTLLLK